MRISLATIINVLIGFYGNESGDPIIKVSSCPGTNYYSVIVASGHGKGKLLYDKDEMWAFDFSHEWSLLFVNMNHHLIEDEEFGDMTIVPESLQEEDSTLD